MVIDSRKVTERKHKSEVIFGAREHRSCLRIYIYGSDPTGAVKKTTQTGLEPATS